MLPAETPAARSISDMIQPPKISPFGLVSAGIATVRLTWERFKLKPAREAARLSAILEQRLG